MIGINLFEGGVHRANERQYNVTDTQEFRLQARHGPPGKQVDGKVHTKDPC